jgi:hypothetical protein
MSATTKLSIIKTEAYEGPDRRSPAPLKAYDKTIVNSEARLPPISSLGRGLVALAVNNMDPKEVAVLAMHLNHTLREASINDSRKAAENGGIEKGTYVRLARVSTVAAKFEGMVGVVQQISKLRCYVKLRGIAKPLYVYMAEVEKLTAAQYKKLSGVTVTAEAPKKNGSTSKKNGAAKKSGAKGTVKKAGAKTEEQATDPKAA